MDPERASEIDPAVVQRLPYSFARKYGVMVARVDDEAVETWVRDGETNPLALDEIRRALRLPVRSTLVESNRFDHALERAYAHVNDDSYRFMEDISQDQNLSQLVDSLPRDADLLETNEAPIIRFVNQLLAQALREKASDIHFEMFENRLVVRFRIDGALWDIIEPPRSLHAAVVSRIKIMGRLDIAEKRLPQDGRYTLFLASRPVDVRISTLPTGHGERIVMRLLDKKVSSLDLDQLGMSAQTSVKFKTLVKKPHGIILVVGPTGSGKTTTLYAALKELDLDRLNIMTVEDPIEYDLDGISQTQVNPGIDMTFARALRSILRQDPDVVMIGEIRDLDTARIAVQASLTGHLVFATLHTNDSVGAVTRLVDMGVEPYLLSSSLLGAVAQRLVRRLCVQCRTPVTPDSGSGSSDRGGAPRFFTACGCSSCRQTGYQGRTGIFELFLIDQELQRMIHDGAPEYDLRDYALKKMNMASLRHDGDRLVDSGATSPEEVYRVTEA